MSTTCARDLGTHQRRTCSAFVHASNTSLAGARKVRAMTISRSPTSSIFVSPTGASLAFLAFTALLLALELLEELVHLGESVVPDPAVAFEPVVQLAQRLRTELVEPLLRARLHVDEAGLLEHAQVLRHLGLRELEALADVVHRARPGEQQLDDAKPTRLGEGGERVVHGSVYAHARIFLSRNIRRTRVPCSAWMLPSSVRCSTSPSRVRSSPARSRSATTTVERPT